MKTNYLAGPRQRIARAKFHIRNLNSIVKSYIRRKPYKHVIEPHPDGIHEIHKLKAKRPALPRSFADVSTDAVENLRAALDQAMYAIAIAHGIADDRVLRIIAFPFSSSAMNFQPRMTSTCPGFKQEILKLLESSRPYKGGNNVLWAINELANTSKHKTLTTVAFRIIGAYTHEIRGLGNMVFLPEWDRDRNEFVLGTAVSSKGLQIKVGFAYSIAFDDISFLAGRSIVDVLNNMAHIVEGLIDEMESVGCGIGLFK